GSFLRDIGFVWCPEGLDEADARLLGDVRGRDVLEIGCGAAQCARGRGARGAGVAACDSSGGRLRPARRIDAEPGLRVPAGQCARWLVARGARVAAFDISRGQLLHARRIDEETGVRVPAVQADAEALPFAAESFDVACSAFGALPFVADAGAVFREVRRVLR